MEETTLPSERRTTVIPFPRLTSSYSFHEVPNSESIVATGPLSQPMGSCPPSRSSHSMTSWAEGEVESPFVGERMKSKIMLPGRGVRIGGMRICRRGEEEGEGVSGEGGYL